MQSNSRTFVSVVGTLTMVLLTLVLAAWSPPQIGTQTHRAVFSEVAQR